jgi:hypothetical protein
MYDLYQHKVLGVYRVIIPTDAPFPTDGNPRNWDKVKTIENVWPEAQERIDQQGYCIYVDSFTFKEIS